jgi:hypothetical protein
VIAWFRLVKGTVEYSIIKRIKIYKETYFEHVVLVARHHQHDHHQQQATYRSRKHQSFSPIRSSDAVQFHQQGDRDNSSIQQG